MVGSNTHIISPHSVAFLVSYSFHYSLLMLSFFHWASPYLKTVRNSVCLPSQCTGKSGNTKEAAHAYLFSQFPLPPQSLMLNMLTLEVQFLNSPIIFHLEESLIDLRKNNRRLTKNSLRFIQNFFKKAQQKRLWSLRNCSLLSDSMWTADCTLSCYNSFVKKRYRFSLSNQF